jgi:hypothetical protein
LRQRSKISWLKEGDRNTKNFHRKATWRAKKNTISSLMKEDGQLTQDPNEMGSLASNFFQWLFTKDDRV